MCEAANNCCQFFWKVKTGQNMWLLYSYLYVVIAVLHINLSQGDVDQCGENKVAVNQVSALVNNNTLIRAMRYKHSTCTWQIKAPAGLIAQVNIGSISFDDKCENEYLRIYDGASPSDKLVAEYCKTKRKPSSVYKIRFSGENAMLEFKQGASAGNLFAFFTKALVKPKAVDCKDGKVIASSTKSNFTSPGYPKPYTPGTSCQWVIEAPIGKYLKLTFTNIDVEFSCEAVTLKVYDGDTETPEDLLKDRCYRGNSNIYLDKDQDIFSYGQKLLVTFKVPAYFVSNKDGFQAFYTAVDGGSECTPNNANNDNIHMAASSGKITSPGFPTSLPKNAFQCIWRLRAPKGEVIKIDLDSVSLKSRRLSFKCPTALSIDTNIGHGLYTMSEMRCDNYLYRSYVSDGRRMEIEYKQEQITSKENPVGFNLEYSTLPLVMTGSCGANRKGTIQVKGDAGTFHSPNYPYYHPTDMTCRWDITVTAGQVIELTTTTYQLNKDCSKQWVRIYDGPSTSSPVIIKLCASYTRSFFSSSNRAIVEFVTEGSTQSKGFYVTYSARMAKPKSYACSSARWPDKIDAFSGKIASDRFPLRYSNNARCWLQIKAPKVNYIVNLTFTSLDLEPDGDKCEKDSVQVSSNNYKLARLCGKKKTPLSFLSKFSNEMDITFWADAVGRYPGFDATFTSVQDLSFGNCTEQGKENIIPMTSPSGTIFSPRYPNFYPEDMRCTWQIDAPKDKFLRLSFDDIWLQQCSQSSVEIRDKDTDKLLDRLCKYPSTPAVFFSKPGSGLVVKFKSSSSSSFNKGFTAHYETVSQLPSTMSCGQNTQRRKLEGSTGSIASYEYPLKYQNNVQCTWIIKGTSSSYTFKIKFDYMDIEPSPGCKDDYVEIKDGPNSFGESLGKFCGSSIPDSFKASESGIFVEFKTNGTGRYGGFKLTYEETYNVRTIVLIAVFSTIGGLALLCLIGYMILKCCCDDDSSDNQGFESVNLQPKD